METVALTTTTREPWNKGKLVGQKNPFKLKEIWAIRMRLQLTRRCRELALFNLAIDSKLRACDLMQLKVRDVLPRSDHDISGTRSATKDSATRSIRNHRARTRRGSGLDHPFSVEARGFSVPKPNTLVTGTCLRGSMPGSSIRGSDNWDWIQQVTVPTRLDERRT